MRRHVHTSTQSRTNTHTEDVHRLLAAIHMEANNLWLPPLAATAHLWQLMHCKHKHTRTTLQPEVCQIVASNCCSTQDPLPTHTYTRTTTQTCADTSNLRQLPHTHTTTNAQWEVQMQATELHSMFSIGQLCHCARSQGHRVTPLINCGT